MFVLIQCQKENPLLRDQQEVYLKTTEKIIFFLSINREFLQVELLLY